jgi:hypothetical protein
MNVQRIDFYGTETKGTIGIEFNAQYTVNYAYG